MNEGIQKERIKRLARWAGGERAGPVKIDFEPTHSCNLKCKFCWQRSEDRLKITNYSRALTEERLLQIVHEAAALGVLEWQIAGGWEPMARPDTALRIMNLIKQYGMFGCLTTNGTLFTEESARNLVEIGWDKILFSLEGPNPEIHDYVTGVAGSFERSVNTMRYFKKYREEYGSRVPAYSFHAVLTNRNYNHLKEMVEWGHELGCDGVCFEPLNVWSEAGETLKLSEGQKTEFQKGIQEALELSWKLSVPTNLESLQESRLIDKTKMDMILVDDAKKKPSDDPFLSAPCYEPWLNMEIRASGHVVMCRLCDFQDDAEKIHSRPLHEIWYGPYFAKLREDVVSGRLPSYCRTCASGIVVETRKTRDSLARLLKSPLHKLRNRIRNNHRLSPLVQGTPRNFQ
ncbi:MAG: radical SAM protein [archaeon]